MTRVRIVLAVVVLLVFSGCTVKSSRPETSNENSSELQDSLTEITDSTDVAADEVIPMAADELFDDFFFNFAVNKKLQMSRIKFPLPEVRGDRVDLIQAKEWKTDYFFMRQDYYTLLFNNEQQMEVVKDTNIDHVVVEKIYFGTKSVKQYVFERKQGAWMMQKIEYIPIASSHNATFLQFYEQFARDMEYQTAHLCESVTFVGPDPDDDFSTMEGIITVDTWPAFAPQLPTKMIYNIVYGEPKKETDRKVFVLRGIANGLEMELVFRRENGEWMLAKMTT